MIWLVVAILLVCFAGVLLVGAPYVPTLTPQVRTALELVDLQPGETLIELGCGDGKVLLAAARQGLRAVGYELNPILALIAWLRTRRYRREVRIIWGDFWRADWPPAEAIFTFLLPKYMKKLDTKIAQYSHRPVKLVSHAFTIPGRRPARQRESIFLYRYR